MSKIFLSHTNRDKPFVRKLAADLRRYGHTVWIDEAEINIGDSLIRKITEGLDQVDYVAIILSKASIKSVWVQKEIEIASNREIQEKKVIVLPIIIENVSLPGFLKGKLYADFSLESDYEEKFRLLLRSLGDSKSLVRTDNNDELLKTRKELNEAKETIKKYKSDIDRITNHTFSTKSEELKARIEEENKLNPEFAPINNVYAFQVGNSFITLGYILHVLSKIKRQGAHQLEPFLTMHNKWDDVTRMLEAYSDMINQASNTRTTAPNNPSSNKNILTIIGVVVSILIFLFGNNILGRIFNNSDETKVKREIQTPIKQEQSNKINLSNLKKREIDLSKTQENNTLELETVSNELDSLNTIEKNPDLISDDKLIEEFFKEEYPSAFNKLIQQKKLRKAQEILELAKSKTTQSVLLKKIENRKKSILLIMEKDFDDVWFSFPDKLVLTEKNGKYGLYNKSGIEVIKPKFDNIDPIFFYPLLLTSNGNKRGFLNNEGIEIFPPIFTDVEPYYFSPLFRIKENGKYGFINKEGEMVVEPVFTDVTGREGDLIVVSKNSKWGLIDTNGIEVVKIKFETNLIYDKEGIALTKLNGEKVFINRKGEVVKNPAFNKN